MILLKLGVNQIYLTISELNLINNAVYYIDITDESTKELKRVTLLDTSTNAIRYNQYQITVVDNIINEDLANGIVNLNTGKHTYTFYSSNFPITPNAENICEYGIIKVLRNSIEPGKSYTDTIPKTIYKIYTGNINDII
jgi:hypothetical protein